MFYKVEDGFYINADKIATIEFSDKDFADISFSGNGADEAISCELAKQIMDDMGCSGFNPYEIDEKAIEEFDSRDDCDFYTSNVSTKTEDEKVQDEKPLTFFELAKHAYALGFKYATPVKKYSKTVAFWSKKPFYDEETKSWELSEGQAFTVETEIGLVGLVNIGDYIECEVE